MKIFYIGTLLAFAALGSSRYNMRKETSSNHEIPSSHNKGACQKQSN